MTQLREDLGKRLVIPRLLGAVLIAVLLLGVAWRVAMGQRVTPLVENTVTLSLSACLLAVPVGSLLAFLLVRTDLPGRRAFAALCGLMLFMPLYLQAAAWDAGFGKMGWYSLRTVTFDEPWLNGMRAAVWVHALAAVPWVVLIVGVALRFVEPELEEAALLDGSVWAVLRHVTLPSVAPAMLVAAIWTLATTAGEMTVTDLYQVRTFAEELYTQFALGETPSAVAIPLLLTNGAVLVLVAWAIHAILNYIPAGKQTPARPPWTFSLGPAKWLLAGLTCALLLWMVGVPLLNLLYKASVVVEQTASGRTRTWSLAAIANTLGRVPRRFGDELRWTAIIGGTVAAVSVAVSLGLTWLARGGGWRMVPAVSLGAIAAVIPGPLLGLGVLALFGLIDLPIVSRLQSHSILGPVLTLTVRSLPFTLLAVGFGLRTVPSELLDAAASDGAGRLRQLLYVVLPTRWPVLCMAWIIALAVAVGDLAASVLVVPPGLTTVSVRVFQLIHFGFSQDEAGLCLTSSAIFAGLAGCAWWLGSRRE